MYSRNLVQTLFWTAIVLLASVNVVRGNEVLDSNNDTGTTSGVAQDLAGCWKWLAQSFKPTANRVYITKVQLWLERNGTPPSDVTFYLRSDASSNNIVTKTITSSELPNTGYGDWHTITMPQGTSLNANAVYWLVLYADGHTSSNCVSWFHPNNSFAGGDAYLGSLSSPGWPPTNNWSTSTSGDYAFRIYYDDGWQDLGTTTTVTETVDPIQYPTKETTVQVTIKDSNNANVPGGTVTVSVSPAAGTFEGGGHGPVQRPVSGGQASVKWTAPKVFTNDVEYTFTAVYDGGYSNNQKNYQKSQPATDKLTVKHSHKPEITAVTASLNDRGGNNIGVFVGGDSAGHYPALAISNTFTATVTDDDTNDIAKVQFFLDQDPNPKAEPTGVPYEYTLANMGALTPGVHTLRIVAWDKDPKEPNSTTVTRNLLIVDKPPWLGTDYISNQNVSWDGAHKYIFTGKIPNPALTGNMPIHIPYLDNNNPPLQNHFDTGVDIVETFTAGGDWTFSVQGVMNATVLSLPLLDKKYPATITPRDVTTDYERWFGQATWSYSQDLFDKTVNVYDGTIASFNVLGIQFDVNLSVDFGFSASVTISGSLGSALTPDEIRIAPTMSPYVAIDISLDILWGVATVGAQITPTFSYTLPLVFKISHNPHVYWDQDCLEFVLKAKFYVDLLWGAGHWESDEQSYGHVQQGGGCNKAMAPPMILSAARLAQQGSSRLKLFQAPSIAFDPNGHGMAVWIHDNDPDPNREDPEVYYCSYAGGAWGLPQPLNNINNQRWDTDPKVVFVGNNQAVCVWTQNTLTEAQGLAANTIKQILEAQDLYTSTWNGVAWTVPAPLTNDVLAVKPSDGRVALAGDPANGRAIAVWVRDADGDPNTTNDWDIYYSVYQGGQWNPRPPNPPARLGPANVTMEAEPDVAFAANGTATCAWVSDNDCDAYTNNDRTVVYSRWNAGVWAAPAALPPPVPPNPPPQGTLWPSVTHDGGNNPVIVFTSRKQDPSGLNTGEGFKDKLWMARLIGGQWQVMPSGGTGEGRIAARWPVAKRRPDNFIQVIYRTDDETGLNGFDGDVGETAIDVRHTTMEDSPGRVPSNDSTLDWQIDMDVDNAGDVQILWVREGSNHPGATFGDGYDDLKLMVLPTGKPNLAIKDGGVTLSEVYPLPPNNVTISAKVENLNAKEVANPFDVRFYLDAVAPANLLGTQVVNALGPNNETTVSLIIPAPPGSHVVYAVADGGGVIPETDEGDNTSSATVWLKVPPGQVEAYPNPSTCGNALSWRAPVMPPVQGYMVYRSVTPGTGYSPIGTTGPDGTEFADVTAQPDVTYYYVVTAVNQWSQESGYSEEVSSSIGPDTDGDGIPDMSDPDDDNDGMPDDWETTYAFNPLDPSDAAQDADGDGFSNLTEYQDGTNPRDANSHRDNTPPTSLTVTDEGTYGTSPSSLSATWSASDPESGIAEYQYAVGTSPGATNVVAWTSAGTSTGVTCQGLSLSDGQAYYFSVKALNGVDLWSTAANSDGITVDSSPPSRPLVNDGTGADIGCQQSTTSLSANWSSADPHSGIAAYWYAVGTAPHGDDIVSWTNAGSNTSVTLNGLSLSEATTYYFSVRADNNAGLSSAVGISNGIIVKPAHCAADLDNDCDVDSGDFALLEACDSGPQVPHNGTPTCQAADFDQDGDVDQTDFAVWQRCYNGPNNPADPSCAQ